ncbi:n-acetyltransferase-related [Holotrichia oblita]|uniref:N-acetyltransferase-related n=1 Tax=Holotrichia oblita TaxID=644536 RepID=A0ACB9T9V2_HOLOL|nr:n-acetyltransferase-related [Holotrichia oblita]
MQAYHELLPPDHNRRMLYCQWFTQYLLNNNDLLDLTFTDEAWFHLLGYINSETMRMWSAENLHIFHEPITDYLKICENQSALNALKKFSTKNLNQNLSFVVRDGAGNLLGVCLNSIHTRNDSDDEVTDPLFGKITTFLGYGYEEARVFEKFPDIESVVYIDILSVDKSAGGRGIGTLLVQHIV